MKKVVLAYRRKTLRFTRWSRKNYGAFVSLKAVVSIGVLARGVVDALLRKNGMQSALETFFRDRACDDTLLSADRSDPPPFPATVESCTSYIHADSYKAAEREALAAALCSTERGNRIFPVFPLFFYGIRNELINLL